MSLNDILVQVDTSEQSRKRVETAIGIASSFGSHLTGVGVVSRPSIPAYVEAQIGSDILHMQFEKARDAMSLIGSEFEKQAEKASISHEWRSVNGLSQDAILLHGRYADMAIVGQQNPDKDNAGTDVEMPDRLILSLGRPVLVVPYVGSYPEVGNHIMVAWDGSRQATRAVNDALPFLCRAKKVSVMVVNPQDVTTGMGDIPGADICLHLARHGVNAEARHLAVEDIGIGDMLLSRAADEGVDMFVMGAYGHARWRELVLGGVTQFMLEHMTQPVLMSH